MSRELNHLIKQHIGVVAKAQQSYNAELVNKFYNYKKSLGGEIIKNNIT